MHVPFYRSLFGTEVNKKMNLITKIGLWGLLICAVLALVPAVSYGTVQENLILSTTGTATLGGLRFKDGDLVKYNPNTDTATLFFSESLFSHNKDIDAVEILENGHILLSTTRSAKLGGLRFKDGDLVEYDPGTDTATLYFSEGLFSHNEDIDAVEILENGHILLSTQGSARLGGLRFKDGDLVEYDPGTNIATLFFSESLFSHNKDIDAVEILENGHILLSTTRSARLGGLRFKDGDLVEYNPGTDTATLFFSEGLFSHNEDIDAVSIIADDTEPVPEPATLLLLGLGALWNLKKIPRTKSPQKSL